MASAIQRKIKKFTKQLKKLHKQEDAYDAKAKKVHDAAARIFHKLSKLKDRV